MKKLTNNLELESLFFIVLEETVHCPLTEIRTSEMQISQIQWEKKVYLQQISVNNLN